MGLLLALLLMTTSQDVPPAFPTADIANDRIQATVYLPDAQRGLLPRHALRLVRRDRQPAPQRPRVLRSVVRASRSAPARRHHRPGGGVPGRRVVGRLRGRAGRRHVPEDRRGPRAQARRAGVSTVRHLRHRRRRHVGHRARPGRGDLRPHARRLWRLRLRLSQDAAARGRHAGARARAQEHGAQAHRDERVQPQLLHARPPADLASRHRTLSVRGDARRGTSARWPSCRGATCASAANSRRARRCSPNSRGSAATVADYDFRMEQRDTGAAVRIRGDRPLTRLVFWSAARTVCPEPYVDASVDPGQETTWRITYEFSGR